MPDTTNPNGEVELTESLVDEVTKAMEDYDNAEGNSTQSEAEAPAEAPESKEEVKEEPEQKPEEVEKKEDLSLKEPTRHAEESDTQYNIRREIWLAGRAKASAESDEEKSVISQRIKDLRKELGKNSYEEKVLKTNQEPKVETTQSTTTEVDEDEVAAREALKKLGYVDKSEVEKLVLQMVEARQKEQELANAEKEHTEAISEFYKSRKDLAVDKHSQKLLENYVIENFNITPSTPKAKLIAHMEMAANYLFPRSKQSITTAEQKRETVNISSTSRSVPSGESLADEMRKAGFSEQEIKASGW